MRYLVAYDIAHPRRLQRVARHLERRAVRCQKSVFLFEGEPRQATALLDELVPLMNVDEDCVQLWRLNDGQPWHGQVRGAAALLGARSVVLGGQGTLWVDEP